MSSLVKKLTRLRMAETGEKYTTARRAVLALSNEEWTALRERERQMRARQRYPVNDRDGLDRRHVLSAMETNRRRH
jgi:hypothetical protein